MTNCGHCINFIEHCSDYNKITIPIIQRDYAQGRDGTDNSEFAALCKEVRSELINNLKDAIVNNRQLTLDYIYGSKENGIFYPIDGQQRLTTLFLLHWYIASKEGIIDSIKDELKKFSYETRDTAQEFCLALCAMKIAITKIPSGQLLSQQIKDDSKYYNVFNSDPTVKAMLVMLDTIHAAFKDINIPVYERLNNIKFWELDLENFGLTDDLFVKMNARGKRLSRFDIFKSELEAALKRAAIMAGKHDIDGNAITWITEIDNDYLDAFWKEFGIEYCENNMFRLCIFISKCFELIKGTSNVYDEDWEKRYSDVNYKAQVEQIAQDEELLTTLCNAFNTFHIWKQIDQDLKALFYSKGNGKKQLEEWTHNTRVRIFAIIYWHAKLHNDCRQNSDFENFRRILLNYIQSHREYNAREGTFASIISKETMKPRLNFIKTLIDKFANQQSDFNEFIKSTNENELEFERQKLQFPHIDEIIKLENSTYLGRNIQNFFHNNTIYITANELNEIMHDDTLRQLALRVILSYANNIYGDNSLLLFDKLQSTIRKREPAFDGIKEVVRRHMMNIPDEYYEFGNKVLSAHDSSTSQLTDLSKTVQKFTEEFHKCNKQTVKEKLESMLNSAINRIDTKPKMDLLDYFVKYKDFYNEEEKGFVVFARRNYDLNSIPTEYAYQIYCINKNMDLYRGYYQPFYKAIQTTLKKLGAKHNTLSGFEYKGNEIDTTSCKLNNGWSIIMQTDGSIEIKFNGNIPTGLNADEYLLKNSKDCIEAVTNFIMQNE